MSQSRLYSNEPLYGLYSNTTYKYINVDKMSHTVNILNSIAHISLIQIFSNSNDFYIEAIYNLRMSPD